MSIIFRLRRNFINWLNDEIRKYGSKTFDDSIKLIIVRVNDNLCADVDSYFLHDRSDFNRICVYTDGSWKSKKDVAGIGVFWASNNPLNVSARLDGVRTNINAEITAVTKAMEIARSLDIQKLLIITDNKFVIDCMTKWIYNWRRNGWSTTEGNQLLGKRNCKNWTVLF